MPKACRCCEKRADGLWQSAPRPEERADWEPMLRLNRGVVLPFETPASLEPAPKAKHTAKE